MSETLGARLALLISVGVTAVFLHLAGTRFHSPYPSLFTSLSSPKVELPDVAGGVLGLRRLSADMAWIQTLQYYGSQEIGQTEQEFENGIGRYPDFLDYCKRVVAIDPYFTFPYYYGGAVLGWNLNRLSEAEELLKAGITANPTEWRLPQYLAGLAYQKDHDIAKLAQFLESVTSDPQCPLMMKALLANLYKKQKAYGKALAVWQGLFQSGDPVYMNRARQQFREIQRLLQTARS